MLVLADLFTGKTEAAEVFFLVACVLALVAGVALVMEKSVLVALLAFAVACLAFGWVLL